MHPAIYEAEIGDELLLMEKGQDWKKACHCGMEGVEFVVRAFVREESNKRVVEYVSLSFSRFYTLSPGL